MNSFSRLSLLATIIACCVSCTRVVPFQPGVANGGRAVSIAVNPVDNSQMIVASETGGMFATKDGGNTWRHIDGLSNFGINDVAFAPGSGDIVIATAGPAFKVVNDGFILRSTDGGSTWAQPPGSLPPTGPTCPPLPAAYGVSFEPATKNVYVATDCGLAVSNDAGASWGAVISVDPNLTSQNSVKAVLALPGGDLVVATDNGVYARIANSWTKATGGGPPFGGSNHSFAASPYNSKHIFFASAQGWNTYHLWLSIDGGLNWPTDVNAPNGWSRAPFVRTAKAVTGTANQFDVYWGAGDSGFFRATFAESAAGPTLVQSFASLGSDHADFADVAFDTGGTTPLLLATDGGVHKTPDKGASWTLAGGGAGGYDALQITEITGQAVSGQNPHQDLYFGTQDNKIWGSSDGGISWPASVCYEGFYLRTPPTSVDHMIGNTPIKVIGAAPNCTSPWISDFHLSNLTAWPNPANAGVSSPFLVKHRYYIQQTTVAQSSACPNQSNVSEFMLTPDEGVTWNNAFTICEEVWGIPMVVGPSSQPTIYQSVRRPGLTANQQPRVGLLKITNLFPGPAVVVDADVHGLGGLGVFPTMFAWYMVFGADTLNPDTLLAPDIDANQMKISRDGGQNWHSLSGLTDLVTATGTFNFALGLRPLVDAIGFDPHGSCLALVGTAQNGVLRTKDAGRDWDHIVGSDQITNLSSFYFPPTGPIIASTYGRGLWKLKMRRGKARCPLFDIPQEHFAPPTLIDPLSGVRIPFKDIGDPTVCGACQYLIVKNGSITNVELTDQQVQRVFMSGGSIYQFDAGGKEVPLQIPNSYGAAPASVSMGIKKNSGVDAVLRDETPVRGLVVEGTNLRGFITSSSELSIRPSRIPYTRVIGKGLNCGVGCGGSGATITIAGDGFTRNTNGENPLRIAIGGVVVPGNIPVSEDGHFAIPFQITRTPGEYAVVVEQTDGKRLSMDRTVLKVVPGRPPAAGVTR